MARQLRSPASSGSDAATDPQPCAVAGDDDDSGNEDLTLEILERARRRSAAAEEGGFVESPDAPSTSADPAAKVEGGTKKPKRGRRKKQEREAQTEPAVVEKEVEATVAPEDGQKVIVVEEEQFGSESAVTEANEVSDNLVLRKLLRGPRYFDPGESIMDTCYNCGEEGHVAAACTMERRQKPCFVCGQFGHVAKQCTQGQACFICKTRGHIAKDCPDKHKRISSHSMICLKCGEIGHDMFSCQNGYPSEDMKEIQCYICKQHGHLCCIDMTDGFTGDVSCYNCAQPGHIGLGCMKNLQKYTDVVSTCYNCGEEGHFARGCTSNKKSAKPSGGMSAPSFKKARAKADSGNMSAPQYAAKRKKRVYNEWDTPMVKSRGSFRHANSGWLNETDDRPRAENRRRGGWIPDETETPPPTKYRGSGGWTPYNDTADFTSPRTQDRSYHKKHRYEYHRGSSGGSSFRSGQKYG